MDLAKRVGEWRSTEARVVLLEANRGFHIHRDTCPHTQVWLLLRGEWSEKTPKGPQATMRPTEIRSYVPRHRCDHISESDSLALSVEIYGGASPGSPERYAPALYQLASAAKRGSLDSLQVSEWVTDLTGRGEARPESQIPSWLLRARDILSDSPPTDLDLSQLAGEVGISPNHLSATFRQFFGQSISGYVRRRRVLRAVSLASQRRGPGELPAWAEAGFHDAPHFWRACRQELGLTPTEIRALGR